LSATLMSLKCFITLETEVSRSVLLMQTWNLAASYLATTFIIQSNY
jgi:hypothetical protein